MTTIIEECYQNQTLLQKSPKMPKMSQNRSKTAQNTPKSFKKNHEPPMKTSYNNHPRGIVPESNSSPEVSKNAQNYPKSL